MGRLERYALFSLFQLFAVVAVVLGPVPAETAGLVVLIASVPVALGWGHVHAHLAFNEQVEEPRRTWWRVAIWCVPGAVAVYWLLYVRPSRAPLK